jgi:hypothetical protein
MVRVPDKTLSKESAGLYLASRSDEIINPVPFFSVEEVVVLGFAPELLRAAETAEACCYQVRGLESCKRGWRKRWTGQLTDG